MRTLLTTPAMAGEEKTLDNCDIELSHITFAYDQDDVIRDVSCKIPQGSVTALVGPSGSGKSTISKLIARFWDIQKGTITVGGKDIKTMEPESLMSYMSFVFQDVTLFNDTVMNNIRIGNPNEATASLDPENEVLVQKAIAKLVEGKTVIMIAHRLRIVVDADQILVLEDGRLVESGTHSELMEKKGLYQRLYHIQQESLGWAV